MNELIVILSRAHIIKKTIQYYCTLYKCGLGDTLIDVYLNDMKHVRWLELKDILPMLQQHNIVIYFGIFKHILVFFDIF